MLTRRKVETVGESYGVDISQEEQEGRLVQHVEGKEANHTTLATEGPSFLHGV